MPGLDVAGEGVDRLVVVVVAVEDTRSRRGWPWLPLANTTARMLTSLRNPCGPVPGRGILPGMPKHPVRDDIDLLDGAWYSTEPHDDWTWMREHAPVYYDAKSDVWAHHQVRRRAGHREGRQGLLELQARPARTAMPLPMMISMDNPRAPAAPVARVPRVHAEARPPSTRRASARSATRSSTGCANAASATSCGTSPRRSRCCSSPTCSGSSPSAYDDLLRWSDDLIRATTAGTDARGRGRVDGGQPRVPRAAARRDRRPALEAAAVRPHLAALPRRGQRRAARRRVDRAGDAAHPHRRRRDHPARDHRRAARAVRAPRPARRSCATTPARCRPGVEEMLRWVSPIKNMSRTVVRRGRAAG